MKKNKQIKKKIIVDDAQYMLTSTTKDHARKLQMNRYGASWNPLYRKERVVTVVSDGNGVNVTVHGNDEVDSVRMNYLEAFELGVALIEYTKLDPFQTDPLYEVVGSK